VFFVLFCLLKGKGRSTRAHALYIYSRLRKKFEVNNRKYKENKKMDGEGMQEHAHFTSRAVRDID